MPIRYTILMMTNTINQQNTIHNRYHLHEKLGWGGMGEVYRATDRLTGDVVALKRVLNRLRCVLQHL